jgi:hypothetical protein
MGRVGPEAKLIRNGTSGPSYDDVIQEVARVEDGLQGLCAQRLVPDFKNPRNFTEKLEQILTIQAGNPAAPDDIPTPP